MLALIKLILAGALVFVVPGYLLVRALWPRPAGDAPGPIVRGVLTVVLSISITILVGFVLGFLPHAEGSRGWLQTSGSGFPFAEIALLGISGVFLAIGSARGAYSRS